MLVFITFFHLNKYYKSLYTKSHVDLYATWLNLINYKKLYCYLYNQVSFKIQPFYSLFRDYNKLNINRVT